MMRLTRREALRSFGATAALAGLGLPRLAFAAAPTSRRLVVVLLRGGLDGLAAVPAPGDPHYEVARAGLADPPPGSEGGPFALDDVFALHRVMRGFHDFWRRGELLVVHAAASPYRERSHFDAQNVLESGSPLPFARSEGWLNRAVKEVPGVPDGTLDLGISIGRTLPLAMRGPASVSAWSPSAMPPPSDDLLARVARLYEGDAALSRALAKAGRMRAIAGDLASPGAADVTDPFPELAHAAGVFLRDPGGPRVALLESEGWDTHAYQDLPFAAPHRNLASLDAGIAALSRALGEHWRDTVVAVTTEFGRTVAMNGSRGTDHGTAGVAFLLGGAVRGGRVLADWPGLAPSQLHEGRDLRPTTDLRAVLKGVLRDHLGVAEAVLAESVFPDSAAVRPIGGLVASREA